MPGPRIDNLGNSGQVVNNYFLEPVDNTEQLEQLITDSIVDGAKIYVASERKDYYYEKATDSWVLAPEHKMINQDNKNLFVGVPDAQLKTYDHEGVSQWLNAKDPAIEVQEDENLYLKVRPSKPFITEWTTTVAAETISMPLSMNYVDFDAELDWGDGTTTKVVYGDLASKLTHAYEQPGNYQVKVIGFAPKFDIKDHVDLLKLNKVVSWGDHQFSVLKFEGATNLTELPLAGTPDLSSASSMSYAFKATGISAIPAKLLYNAGKVSSVYAIFENCANVTEIPEGLFDKTPSVTNFGNAFKDCGITSAIPVGLFDFTTNVTGLGYAFYGNSIPAIPAGLFDKTPKVTDVFYCFAKNSIAALPVGLVDKLPLLSHIGGMFQDNLITEVPVGFFNYNTDITVAYSVFERNNIEVIPTGLFNYTTKATSFSGVFSENLVTEIPPGLFDFTPNVTDFTKAFYGNKLTAIPAGLFDKTPNVTDFFSTFERNFTIQAIPEKLFDYTTKVTHFYRTFAQNNIAAIPAGLFDNTPLVDNFTSCFFSNSLMEVPAGLFDFTTAVTNFSNAFGSNQYLTTVPGNLFHKTTQVTDFSWLFDGCFRLSLELTSNFFAYAPNVKDYTRTFYNCMELTGSAPAYWNDATVTGDDCYYLCEKLTNYAAIPLAWK